MAGTGVDTFDTTLQKTNSWLKDLMEEMGEQDRENAYAALRAVLHALRDRLTIEEATHLGAQFPILLAGVYYQGWDPTGKPVRYRHITEFLDRVERDLGNRRHVIDAERAVQAVFRVLSKRVSQGEIEDILSSLPSELRQVWPDAA